MQAIIEKSKEEGKEFSANEVCDQVLGTRLSYVNRLGYGLKASAFTSTNQTVIRRLQKENNNLKTALEVEIAKSEKNTYTIGKI